MAQCPDDKGLVMGNAGILRIAPGCPGTVPEQSAFLRLGALTSTELKQLHPRLMTRKA